MQYAGSVQLDSPLPAQVQGQVADQIKRARVVMVAEATDAPAAAAAPPVAAAPPPAPAAAPAPPPPAAAPAPPAAPAKTEVHLGNRGSSLEPALATLDAAGVAARVAAIGPGFSQFAAAIEELACDGAFLASLSPAELDGTFGDIGVTARLQRRPRDVRARAREAGILPSWLSFITRRSFPRRLLDSVGATAGAHGLPAARLGADLPLRQRLERRRAVRQGARDVSLAVLAAPGRASTPRRHGRLRRDSARRPRRSPSSAAAASRPPFGTPAGR